MSDKQPQKNGKSTSSSRHNIGKTVTTDVKAVRVDESKFLMPDFNLSDLIIEMITPITLVIQIPFPESLPANLYARNIMFMIESIDFIYSVYAVLLSGKPNVIKSFVKLVEKNGTFSSRGLFHKSWLNNFFISHELEPLRVSTMLYGSPVTIDLLGIGSILELVRNTIKDVVWRGKYERKLADVDLTEKRNKLKNEKLQSGAELKIQQAQVAKIRLENEKLMLEIIRERFELMQQTSTLNLSDKEKEILISALIPRMEIFSTPMPIALLENKES